MKRVSVWIMLCLLVCCACAFAEDGLDPRIREIYATADRHLFLTEDGTLFITGDDSPNHDLGGSPVPYFLNYGVEEVFIDSYDAYNFAYLKKDGTLWTRSLNYSFGFNSWGQLPSMLMDDVREVFFWFENIYAIRNDGALWTMGLNNDSGMLGNGTRKECREPFKVMDNVKAVYSRSGMTYVHVLTEDGKLYGMGGDEDYPVLGDGSTKYRTTPVLIMENVKDVYNGIRSTFALTDDGEIYAWGVNGKMKSRGVSYWRYLGDGGKKHLKTPVKIVDNVRDFYITELDMCYAVTNDEKLWVWGGLHPASQNYPGNGTIGQVERPTVIMEPECGIRELGEYYVILNDNSLWVWGGYPGQEDAYLVPTRVAENVKAYKNSDAYFHVRTDASYSYLDMDNRLWSRITYEADMKDNQYSVYARITDEYVVVMENVDRYSDYNQNFVRTTDGKLLAWGTPKSLGVGRIGNATSGEQGQWPPVEILLEHYYPEWLVAELTGQPEPEKAKQRVKQFLLTGVNYFALMEDGDLWAWGFNRGGLGLSSVDPVPIPTCVLEDVEQIFYNRHSEFEMYALKTNGELIAWQSL